MPLLEIVQTRRITATIRLDETTAGQIDQYAAFLHVSADAGSGPRSAEFARTALRPERCAEWRGSRGRERRCEASQQLCGGP